MNSLVRRLRRSAVRCSTRWAVGALVVIATVTTAVAVPFELPPLIQSAKGEHHPGKIIWAELVTSDLANAKHFYGTLFGWTFNDIHTGETHYSLALHDGEPVGGIVQRPVMQEEHRHPAWLTFISVLDVDKTQQAVIARGGRVLSPAHTYARRGRQAVFADPEGAVFASLQSSSGDPEDALAEPGEWIWSSLMSHDPDSEAAFYQTVFGYEVFDLPHEDGLQHHLLATQNYARASSNALPAEGANLHPHWLNFVRVTNTAETAAKAQSLGGRILVQPHADRHGGQVAVLADPAGAAFGLLEWTESDTKQLAP